MQIVVQMDIMKSFSEKKILCLKHSILQNTKHIKEESLWRLRRKSCLLSTCAVGAEQKQLAVAQWGARCLEHVREKEKPGTEKQNHTLGW